jgi:hypothetical protein
MVLGLAILLGTAATAWTEYGPLHTINRFALHMLVLTPRPVSAELPGQGNVEATLAMEYGSTFYDYRNERWDLLIDMEVLVAELSMGYGVTDKLAVRLDMPMISMGGGFLDGFLQNYHEALGVSNYDRESRPDDDFAYRVTKDGQLWVQGQSDALRLGDVRLSGQFALARLTLGGYPLNRSVLATIKLPTGDARASMGSGNYDVGLFLPMQWDGMRWSFYLMPGAMWINDPQTLGARVSASNSAGCCAGAAYRWNDRWRWLGQLNYYSSPFASSGLNELDSGALVLSFGFQRTISKALYWEFAFCEDLTRTVPDFNIRLGINCRFSTARCGAKGKKP